MNERDRVIKSMQTMSEKDSALETIPVVHCESTAEPDQGLLSQQTQTFCPKQKSHRHDGIQNTIMDQKWSL